MKTSVAICTYNGEQYIAEQLESILNQKHKVDEIIICDDRSEDKTLEITREIAKNTKTRILIFQNNKQLGSVLNFQKAISLCTNDIVFLADQDDIWLPEKIEIYLQVFTQNPSIDVICSNGFLLKGKCILEKKVTIWDVPKYLQSQNIPIDYFSLISSYLNVATGAAMAIRRDFIIKNLFEIPVLPGIHHDEWIALIAASEGKFYFLNEKLFIYRLHLNQQVSIPYFDENEMEKLNFIQSLKKNKNFTAYKRVLKIISFRYKRNLMCLRSINPENKKAIQLFEKVTYATKREFLNLKLDFKKNHPVHYIILSLFDKFTRKRRLQ